MSRPCGKKVLTKEAKGPETPDIWNWDDNWVDNIMRLVPEMYRGNKALVKQKLNKDFTVKIDLEEKERRTEMLVDTESGEHQSTDHSTFQDSTIDAFRDLKEFADSDQFALEVSFGTVPQIPTRPYPAPQSQSRTPYDQYPRQPTSQFSLQQYPVTSNASFSSSLPAPMAPYQLPEGFGPNPTFPTQMQSQQFQTNIGSLDPTLFGVFQPAPYPQPTANQSPSNSPSPSMPTYPRAHVQSLGPPLIAPCPYCLLESHLGPCPMT
jgi:hypothetical protein